MERSPFIPALLLFTLQVSPLTGQSLAVPPAPRFPETGRLSIDFEAESSVNSAMGDQTLVSSSLQLIGKVPFFALGLEGSVGGELLLGVSFRDDTNDMRLRIEENLMRLGTVLTLPLQWKIDPYVAGSLQTTPTESFFYGKGGPIRLAKFWDPVISTESAGASFLYTGEGLSVATRVGLAMEQIRAAVHTEQTDNRETEGEVETYRQSSGIEFSSDASWQVDSTGTLQSRLALFGTFEDLTTWRVLSENSIRVSFAGVFSFCWKVNVTHDVTQTLRTQLFSGMAIGVSAEL